MVRLRLLILFLFSVSALQAQHLTYAVILKNEKVGELYVQRSIAKKTIDFKLESHITVNKIITMEVDYKLTARFEDGLLVKSITWQRTNQKVNINTITTRIKDSYLIESLNNT